MAVAVLCSRRPWPASTRPELAASSRIAGYSAPPGAWRTGDEPVLLADWERQLWRAADLAPGSSSTCPDVLAASPRAGRRRRASLGTTGQLNAGGLLLLPSDCRLHGHEPGRRQRRMRQRHSGGSPPASSPEGGGPPGLKWRTIGRLTQQRYLTAARSFDDYIPQRARPPDARAAGP